MQSQLKNDLIHLAGTQQRMLRIVINCNEVALMMFVMEARPQSDTSILIPAIHVSL